MKNTTEQGRSMVEMLGVLAVMGVLSMIGVTMYNLLMTRIRANQLAEISPKLTTLAYAKIQTGIISGTPFLASNYTDRTPESLGYTDTIPSNYTVKLTASAQNVFTVTYEGVEDKVCQAADDITDATLMGNDIIDCVDNKVIHTITYDEY